MIYTSEYISFDEENGTLTLTEEGKAELLADASIGEDSVYYLLEELVNNTEWDYTGDCSEFGQLSNAPGLVQVNYGSGFPQITRFWFHNDYCIIGLHTLLLQNGSVQLTAL